AQFFRLERATGRDRFACAPLRACLSHAALARRTTFGRLPCRFLCALLLKRFLPRAALVVRLVAWLQPPTRLGVLVAALDEQPLIFAPAHAHEVEVAAQFLALQLEREL